MIWVGIGIKNHVDKPMIELPNNDPIVPIRVIPPDIPWSIDLNEVIDMGLFFDNLPNSVPHVSDIAAATLEVKRYK